MTIVLCAKDYPDKKLVNKKINLKHINLNKQSFILHAGTKNKDGSLFTNGGRVLNIVVVGNTFLKIRNQIIKIIKTIDWKYGFFRRDIGWRIIKKK